MVVKFFYPYFWWLYSAAWNIQQSLEGLGIASSNFVTVDQQGQILSSYLSPAEAVLPIYGLLALGGIFLFISTLIVGYIFGRRRGAFLAFAVVMLPGLLNLASLWPSLPIFPDTFVIDGNGILGSEWGMLSLVLLGLITGWCLSIIAVDLFRLGDKFWYGYDHIWYAAGLLAGIFFVADSQSNERNRDWQETSRTVQQASSYLLKQVTAFDQWCHQTDNSAKSACKWASDVQQTLLDYSTEDPVIFDEFGPQTTTDVYAPFKTKISPDEIAEIRSEIADYNQSTCPVEDLGGGAHRSTKLSLHCQMTPSKFCRAFPERLAGKSNDESILRTNALASECILPTLVALRKYQESLAEKVKADRRAKHYRWLYYLIFSIFAGGKVASVTVKLADLGKRSSGETRRSLYLFVQSGSGIWRFIRWILGTMTNVLNFGGKEIYRVGRRAVGRLKK